LKQRRKVRKNTGQGKQQIDDQNENAKIKRKKNSAPQENGSKRRKPDNQSNSEDSSHEQRKKKKKKKGKVKEKTEEGDNEERKEKKERKEDKEEKESFGFHIPSITKKRNALAYLSHWKNSRQSWKFKKVCQTYLLQNAYRPDQLDETNFVTFLEYLQGLTGVSKKTTIEAAEKNYKRVSELF